MEESERVEAKPRRTGYGPVAAVLVTIGVYFVSQAFVILVVSMLPLLFGWDVDRLQNWLSDSVFAKLLTVLFVEAVTLWLIWVFLQARKVPLKKIGLVRPEVRDVGYAVAGYIGYMVLFIAITVLADMFFPGLDLEQEQEIGFSRATTGSALWLVFASLVILPPIAEEIITRGFLYTGLRSKLPQMTAAIMTSVLFAAAHLQWGSGNALLWVAALDTFILSMILVHLREKTGSLWSPMLVHAFKNGLAFVLLFILKVS